MTQAVPIGFKLSANHIEDDIDLALEIRAEGGTFRVVALFPPLLECLRRFHVLEELDEDCLHISKGDAVGAAVRQLDHSICAACTKRVFTECTELPGSQNAGQTDQG
jgi:SulP family sulfate permease